MAGGKLGLPYKTGGMLSFFAEPPSGDHPNQQVCERYLYGKFQEDGKVSKKTGTFFSDLG